MFSSNTYSREVSGHSAIVPHLGKFYGILNGIDPDIWDPYSDNFIPVHFIIHIHFFYCNIFIPRYLNLVKWNKELQ